MEPKCVLGRQSAEPEFGARICTREPECETRLWSQSLEPESVVGRQNVEPECGVRVFTKGDRV